MPTIASFLACFSFKKKDCLRFTWSCLTGCGSVEGAVTKWFLTRRCMPAWISNIQWKTKRDVSVRFQSPQISWLGQWQIQITSIDFSLLYSNSWIVSTLSVQDANTFLSVDDDTLPETSENHRYPNVQLTADSPSLISINQLLDSVSLQYIFWSD